MSSINRVFIMGRLGRDPEVRFTPNGMAVCNFSVATSTIKKGQGGEKLEETEWHRLTAFERTAEVIGEYLRKGDLAHFEGRLKTRKWQDKDGKDMYTTEIMVDRMTMLPNERREEGGGDQTERTQPQTAARNTSAGYQSRTAGAPRQPAQRTGTGFDNMDDDVPF